MILKYHKLSCISYRYFSCAATSIDYTQLRLILKSVKKIYLDFPDEKERGLSHAIYFVYVIRNW